MRELIKERYFELTHDEVTYSPPKPKVHEGPLTPIYLAMLIYLPVLH
jgi:hypothetical protein